MAHKIALITGIPVKTALSLQNFCLRKDMKYTVSCAAQARLTPKG